jgi:hypothetical protein
VLAGFHETLRQAEAALAERPRRTALAQSEIDRIAEFHYASVLAGDEEFTTEDAQADEDFARSVAAQFDEAGIEYAMPAPFDAQRPPYGLTTRQVIKRDANLEWWLQNVRQAVARGDISIVDEVMTELLERFHINLDRDSAAYRRLGMAVLRADVRAHEALERRSQGEPIDTPLIAHLEPSIERPATGNTLRAAFEGWKKERERSSGTLVEYERAIELFIQFHGDFPVVNITKYHVLKFREALQAIPRSRRGELAKATLPQLVEWRHAHPEAKGLSPETVACKPS